MVQNSPVFTMIFGDRLFYFIQFYCDCSKFSENTVFLKFIRDLLIDKGHSKWPLKKFILKNNNFLLLQFGVL